MFYIFYMGIDCAFEEIKRVIEERILTEPAGEGGEVLRNTAEEFVVSFDWATLRIKEGGHRLVFASEDYGMELRYSFWFDILSDQSDWAERLMSFTGAILGRFEGDGVLESNGDTAILTRRTSAIVVDDKKLKGRESFPFHALNQPYVEGDIESV
ncbi:SitI3 family protein [Paenibacillus sp. DMB20]|uniref:SitI3 family protein n=1 Tax=Paenibacillus sp. DMB20 TaxID=1642570 RepID=UPI0006278924|nr:SitI3 family protein [Paenibacillus sp. DMB20]KKO55200.1 hypothetical protein XI25_02265 [Paenibacillus sp. DMB20]